MKIKSIILISFYFLLLSLLLVTTISTTPNESTANECNTCHGISHLGHVKFDVSLGISETVLNNVSTTLTATIFNSNFPLSTASISLIESSDFSITNASSNGLSVSLGTLERSSTKIISWMIKFQVTTNKTTAITVKLEGTARDHKVFTYSSNFSKNIFISTVPTPLLHVTSNPISETTFLVENTNHSGQITISNIGNLPMTNIQVLADGPILVDMRKQFSLPLLNQGETVNFDINIDVSKPGVGTVTVTFSAAVTQQSMIRIIIQPIPPEPLTLILGRFLGYITYFLLFLSVTAGTGVFFLKKYISGRKIRILHADLSNLSFTMVVIHAMILTIPNSPWAGTYAFFELIPINIPSDISSFGLELGRLGLLLMYISVISGYYIAKIIKRFGRSVGVSIHMLSYLALIIGVIHASLIGGIAKSNILLIILFLVSLIFIVWLKWNTKRELASRKLVRALKKQQAINKLKTETGQEKMTISISSQASSISPPAISYQTDIQKNQLIIKSLNRKLGNQIGVICFKCSNLNDDDAIFCKICATRLEGIPCNNCGIRNTTEAKNCLNCQKTLIK